MKPQYAPMETIRAAGYGSREAMKETTYWKAKVSDL